MTNARVCQHCGCIIAGRNANARFCSRKCQKKSLYARDPSRQRARCKAYREKDPERHKMRCNVWRSGNRSAVKVNWDAWYSEYREERKAASRKTHRTLAVARHMQDALAAIPAIMDLIANMENANDQ